MRLEKTNEASSAAEPWDGAASFERSEVLHVPTELLRPTLPREIDKKMMAALVRSIQVVGIINPILVWWNEEQRKYDIIAGHQRTKAAKALGLPTVPCIVTQADDRTRVAAAAYENWRRADERPWEIAQHVKRMREAGMKLTEIGAPLDKTKGTVSELLFAVTALPEELQKKIQGGANLYAVVRRYKKREAEKKVREAQGITNGMASKRMRRSKKKRTVGGAAGKSENAGSPDGFAFSGLYHQEGALYIPVYVRKDAELAEEDLVNNILVALPHWTTMLEQQARRR